MLGRISDEIILSWGFKRLFIASAAGAFASLALAPFDFVAALFVSFPILVWLLDGASQQTAKGFFAKRRPAFMTGWAFGFGYFTAGLWWLGNTVLVSPQGHLWMLPFAIFGLPAILAIFFGLATSLARQLWSDDLSRIFALSASFGLFEFLRSFVLTGFPWNIIGYAAMPIPLAMQFVEIVGIYGMSILTVFVASTPALLTTKKGLKPGVLLSLLIVATQLVYGAYMLLSHHQAFSDKIVRLVQPSIDQSDKWNHDRRDKIFQTHLSLTSAPTKDNTPAPNIILWPETSVPYILTRTPPALDQIAQTLETKQILLAGAVKLENAVAGQRDQYFNSVYALDSEGEILGSADKMHLVPFGEYLPFEDWARSIGLAPLAESFGGYSASHQIRTIDLPDGTKILPLICYEIIFPKYANRPELNADFIVNVTNDAWYGDTPGPYQHLRQSQIRAIETGLPVIRAGNNGISAITDNRGRILSGMAINYIGFLDYDIPVKREVLLDNNYRFIIYIVIIFGFFAFSALRKFKFT